MNRFGTAIVLAGGKSSRMGFDKQMIEIDGERLVMKTIENLRGVFSEIVVVTNRFELYDGENVTLIMDEIPDKGPLGGLYSGLKNSSSEYAYLIACDMPFINESYIRYMMDVIGDKSIDACITMRGEWIEPFNAFYSKSMIDHLEERLHGGNLSVNGLLKSLECVYIEEVEALKFSSDWSMFSNINTRDDFENIIGVTCEL
jgi:molybdenum cofactor guanylyltransferase